MIGARPEIMQAAPVSEALAGLADEILVHTGQHYDEAMSGAHILATRLPHPRHNLGVGSRPRDEQLALGQERMAGVIDIEQPDAVVVRGDTNATLSGARAAVAAGIPLVHVEAGLRSYRDDMPEEHNRIETDRLADLLLAPTPGARANLIAEGIAGRIEVTGDPAVRHARALARRRRPGRGRVPARHRAPQLQHRRPRAPAGRAGLPRALAVARRLPGPPAHPRRAGDVEADAARRTSTSSSRSPTPACSSSSAARR